MFIDIYYTIEYVSLKLILQNIFICACVFSLLVQSLGNGVKFKVVFFERKPHFLFTLTREIAPRYSMGFCRYGYKSSLNTYDFYPLFSQYITRFSELGTLNFASMLQFGRTMHRVIIKIAPIDVHSYTYC